MEETEGSILFSVRVGDEGVEETKREFKSARTSGLRTLPCRDVR